MKKKKTARIQQWMWSRAWEPTKYSWMPRVSKKLQDPEGQDPKGHHWRKRKETVGWTWPDHFGSAWLALVRLGWLWFAPCLMWCCSYYELPLQREWGPTGDRPFGPHGSYRNETVKPWQLLFDACWCCRWRSTSAAFDSCTCIANPGTWPKRNKGWRVGS